jgi:pilus assembly protein CpaB
VPPGERAVTLGVNDRSGLSGMLKPNDRVDVLFLSTQTAPREGGGDRSSARVLLPNVTVLAVGTRTGLDSTPAEEAAYGTVTLACAPEEAAALALAQSRGELVLVLRNPEDHAATAPTFLEETDLVSGADLARRRQERLEIYRRGIKE